MATQSPPARGLIPEDGVALKEYVEARFDAQKCYNDVRLLAIEKAIEASGKVLEERLLAINARSDANARAIDDLKTFRDRLDGKASQQSVILATILGIAGLVFGVVDLLLKLLV